MGMVSFSWYARLYHLDCRRLSCRRFWIRGIRTSSSLVDLHAPRTFRRCRLSTLTHVVVVVPPFIFLYWLLRLYVESGYAYSSFLNAIGSFDDAVTIVAPVRRASKRTDAVNFQIDPWGVGGSIYHPIRLFISFIRVAPACRFQCLCHVFARPNQVYRYS